MRHTGAVDGLNRHFQQQPPLWIYPLSLARKNPLNIPHQTHLIRPRNPPHFVADFPEADRSGSYQALPSQRSGGISWTASTPAHIRFQSSSGASGHRREHGTPFNDSDRIGTQAVSACARICFAIKASLTADIVVWASAGLFIALFPRALPWARSAARACSSDKSITA